MQREIDKLMGVDDKLSLQRLELMCRELLPHDVGQADPNRKYCLGTIIDVMWFYTCT